MNFSKIGIIPHENTTYTLKAETQAEGETLQGLGGGGEKTKRLSYLRFKALFLSK